MTRADGHLLRGQHDERIRFEQHQWLGRHLVLGHAQAVGGDGHVGEHPVQVVQALLHRRLQGQAAAHLLGQVDGDDLGVALALEAMAGPLEAATPVEVVGELAVVHDRHVGEGVGPVRVGARDVDVALGGHPHVADGVRAPERRQAVGGRHRLGVAEVLDDLQRVAERQHLAAGHILQVVGQGLEVAPVAHAGPVGVLGLALDPVDRGADLAQPGFDLQAVALETFTELEVAPIVGVGQLEPDDDLVGGRAVQRVAGGVRPAVLHGLQHAGHLGPDVARAVPVDDTGDAAHRCSLLDSPLRRCRQGRTSRYSLMSQSLTVEMNRSHSSRL